MRGARNEAERVMIQMRSTCTSAGEPYPVLGPVAMDVLQLALETARQPPLPRTKAKWVEVQANVDALDGCKVTLDMDALAKVGRAGPE